MKLETKYQKLKEKGELPDWMTFAGFQTLSSGYLYKDETPKDMWRRVAKSAASYFPDEESLEERFFNIMWRGWLGLATPVAANAGTNRGFTISCYSNSFADDTFSIFGKIQELAMLSKFGGGVGHYLGDVRGKGSPISRGGLSDGIMGWCKVIDSTSMAISQSGVRRGSSAVYLPITHPDIEDFIDMRKLSGDLNKRAFNTHHAVCIEDLWMQEMLDGDEYKRKLFEKLLVARFERGEPYIFFTDTVNKANPEAYKKNNLSVKTSNICSEITLHTSDTETFVCCLSSLNLYKWDEWKDTDTVELSILFLDAVLQEFIDKASQQKGFEHAVSTAKKGRALGLGVMGFASLLQSKMIPFESYQATRLNAEIFKTIHVRSWKQSKIMAKKYGEPEWCEGLGVRHTHLTACAPTQSNSIISGGISPGIEPVTAVIYSEDTAKGSFTYKNFLFERLLEEKGYNNPDVWRRISNNAGSIQDLDFLSDLEKEVFKPVRQMNMKNLVSLVSQRQKWIDQSQSFNLFFTANPDPQYFLDVHIEAWKAGVKTLYYCRSESVQSKSAGTKSEQTQYDIIPLGDCKACEG